MKDRLKDILKNFIPYSILIIVALILCIPLFSKYLDVYFDDGIQHIARAYSTHMSIENGESTKVLSNLTNGYGYSWDLFYGPLSTIGLLLTNFIMSSWVNAYKLFIFICLILSGITMYKWVYKMTDDKNVAGLAGVLYMSMPYHLTDMYIRNALGEYVSFIFFPLIFLGMYNIFNKDKKDYWLVVGAVGLILTHNLMTILTVVFAFGYLILNLKCLKDKEVRNRIIVNILFILFISAFFWLPMLETAFTTDYKVYEPGAMATKEKVLSYALNIEDLFVTKNGSIYVFELGPHIWIMFCFSIPALKVLEKKHKKEYILFFGYSLFCVFASTKYFPWKYLSESFYIIQFPWRMLAFANLFMAVICSINMGIVIRNYKMRDFIILSIITIIYIVSLKNFVRETEVVKNVDEFYIGTISGRETEIIAGMGGGEYLPTLSDKNRFYIASRENTVLVLEGNGQIENVQKDGLNLKCEITTLEDETIYEFPYIYYPGYKVTLDGCEVPYFESDNGLIVIGINKSAKYDVEINFEETSLTKMSKLFSILSLVGYVAYTYLYIKSEEEIA